MRLEMGEKTVKRKGIFSLSVMDKGKVVETDVKDEELVEKRREQIFNGSIKVFLEKGFDKATVKEIAKASGLSQGTLYNYVRSKTDILYLFYDRLTRLLREEMEKAIEGIDDPVQMLRVVLETNIRSIYKYQDHIMFMYQESKSMDKEGLYTILSRETEYIKFFEDVIRRRFKGQEVDETLVKLCGDIVSYLPVIVSLRRWSLNRRFSSREEVINGLVRFMERGIEIVLREGKEGENEKDSD